MAIQNAIKPTISRPFTLNFGPRPEVRVFTTNAPLIADTFKPLSYPFIAGILDGDGFIRTYKSTGEYEITMHLEDQPFLEQLKQQFGGYVQKVLDKNSMRLHINAKTAINGKNTLIDLTNGLNGHIRNTIRVEQFKELCQALNLEYIEPGPLTSQNGYIAGLFVADGTIYMNCRPSAATKKERGLNTIETSPSVEPESGIHEHSSPLESKIQRILKGVAPLIELKIVNKLLTNVGAISPALGFGVNYFWKKGKNPEGHFAFYIKSETDILCFSKYMSLYKTRSVKHKRLNLVQDFYSLKKQKAHLPNADPVLAILWQALIREWYSSNL